MKAKEKFYNEDLEFARKSIEQAVNTQFKPSAVETAGEGLQNLGMFVICCLAIVFRPLNLLIISILILILVLI